MHLHYIILAHKEPDLLSRLINNLNSGTATFYIHLDKKVNLSDFICKKELSGENVVWINKQFSIKWGHINIIRATIACLKSVKLKEERDRIILLSGQDFPIKSKDYIFDFFYKQKDKIFLDAQPFPVKIWGEKCYSRINNYHVFSTKRGWVYSISPILGLKDLINLPISKKKWILCLGVKVFKKRMHPVYVQPFGGSQWFSINGYALKYLLRFLEKHPDFLVYHCNTLIPDEIFFHSILMSATDPKIKENIENYNHHYIDWTVRNNTYPPAILSEEDYETIKASDKLFCRKVELKKSAMLIDKVELEIL